MDALPTSLLDIPYAALAQALGRREVWTLLQVCRDASRGIDDEAVWSVLAGRLWPQRTLRCPPYPNLKALVADGNRANAELALDLAGLISDYRYKTPTFWFQCRLLRLLWRRGGAQESLRLIFDARGERDLREPYCRRGATSCLAVFELQSRSEAAAARAASASDAAARLAALAAAAGRPELTAGQALGEVVAADREFPGFLAALEEALVGEWREQQRRRELGEQQEGEGAQRDEEEGREEEREQREDDSNNNPQQRRRRGTEDGGGLEEDEGEEDWQDENWALNLPGLLRRHRPLLRRMLRHRAFAHAFLPSQQNGGVVPGGVAGAAQLPLPLPLLFPAAAAAAAAAPPHPRPRETPQPPLLARVRAIPGAPASFPADAFEPTPGVEQGAVTTGHYQGTLVWGPDKAAQIMQLFAGGGGGGSPERGSGSPDPRSGGSSSSPGGESGGAEAEAAAPPPPPRGRLLAFCYSNRMSDVGVNPSAAKWCDYTIVPLLRSAPGQSAEEAWTAARRCAGHDAVGEAEAGLAEEGEAARRARWADVPPDVLARGWYA